MKNKEHWCEECDCEMNPFTDVNGRDGWGCDECGWVTQSSAGDKSVPQSTCKDNLQVAQQPVRLSDDDLLRAVRGAGKTEEQRLAWIENDPERPGYIRPRPELRALGERLLSLATREREAQQPVAMSLDDAEKITPILRDMLNTFDQMKRQRHTKGDEDFLINKTAQKICAIMRELSCDDLKAIREAESCIRDLGAGLGGWAWEEVADGLADVLERLKEQGWRGRDNVKEDG